MMFLNNIVQFKLKYSYYILFWVGFVNIVTAQNSTGNDTGEVTVIDDDQSYCLRFTWLGPEFDNSSQYNTTCSLLLEEKRAIGVPCRQPLVVTYDGTEPDLQYLNTYHPTRIRCRRARGQVCAKYTYSFNNEVQNVTYMCTKVKEKEGSAITSGCYSQEKNGYNVEVCVCESKTGRYLPCNKSNSISASIILLSLMFITYLIPM